MNKLPAKIQVLSQKAKLLKEKPSFTQARSVINAVINLLDIPAEDSWKLFNDTGGKIRSNAGWFCESEERGDMRGAYTIAKENKKNIDLKAYWMQKNTKAIISWLVALTPNFEDEPFYGKLNIGIDFVIPEKADKVIVVLSNNYVLRTLELSGELSTTYQDIFAKWLVGFDFTNKAQVHEILWQSFDIEPLNKIFYKSISSFFLELKLHLTKKKTFDDRHASYFVNRLIGRIVFCWFLDKKGLINPEINYFDPSGKKADDYYHEKLETLFFKVFNTPIEDREKGIDKKTPFLNGGLFEVKAGDKFGNPKLTFPADYFDRLFNDLLRHYNFTTDESTSTFQQVAIDPEMLGRIFENLLAEQVEETGEQARKAKGAFYTPREIVDYMCRESLREYLKGKLGEDSVEIIGKLLDAKEHDWRDQQKNYRDSIKLYKRDILKSLDEIKIIDPACGSGAFPMGMMQLLLECYERLEPRFDPYATKIDIIKNNLYGVDIEPMAVEISRLRAWLSIVVDEEKVEPLPNLDFKFVCANSLLPLASDKGQINFYDTAKLAEEIQRIRDDYYGTKGKKKKIKLRKEFEKLLEGGQQNIFGSDREKKLRTYHPFDEENITQFFDPQFMFGVSGFDIVIANPPYVFSRGNLTKKDKVTFKQLYSLTQFKINLYILFIEMSYKIMRKSGVFAFITPNNWLTLSTNSDLRRFILGNTYDVKLLLNYDNVFKEASVDTCVLIFNKSGIPKIDILKWKETGIEKLSSHHPDYFLGTSGCVIGNISNESKTVSSICEKISLHSLHLSEFAEVKNGVQAYTVGEGKPVQTKDMKEKRVYHSKSKKGLGWIKYLDGVDVCRYWTGWSGQFIKYGKNLSRARKPELFNGERLLVRQIPAQPPHCILSCYIKEHTINDNNSMIIKSSQGVGLKYILGVINSSLTSFWFVNQFGKLQRKIFPQFKINELKQFPIPQITSQNQPLVNKIESLVDQILSTKKENPQADTSALEAEIDELVFDLYDLTPKERKLILGKES